jgi:hypothetical protein
MQGRVARQRVHGNHKPSVPLCGSGWSSAGGPRLQSCHPGERALLSGESCFPPQRSRKCLRFAVLVGRADSIRPAPEHPVIPALRQAQDRPGCARAGIQGGARARFLYRKGAKNAESAKKEKALRVLGDLCVLGVFAVNLLAGARRGAHACMLDSRRRALLSGGRLPGHPRCHPGVRRRLLPRFATEQDSAPCGPRRSPG